MSAQECSVSQLSERTCRRLQLRSFALDQTPRTHL